MAMDATSIGLWAWAWMAVPFMTGINTGDIRARRITAVTAEGFNWTAEEPRYVIKESELAELETRIKDLFDRRTRAVDARRKASTEPAPSVPPVQEQLIVFAREISELYRLERSRNAGLKSVNSRLQGQLKAYIRMARRNDDRIEELKMAILRHLAADHNDGSADDLRDALKGDS